MFMMPFKFLISFILSFLILSIPINKKPLFSYLSEVSKPLVNKTNELITSFFDQSANGIKNLFITQKNKFQTDSTTLKSSSTQKDLHHEYTPEEKKQLEEVLNRR